MTMSLQCEIERLLDAFCCKDGKMGEDEFQAKARAHTRLTRQNSDPAQSFKWLTMTYDAVRWIRRAPRALDLHCSPRSSTTHWIRRPLRALDPLPIRTRACLRLLSYEIKELARARACVYSTRSAPPGPRSFAGEQI